LGSRSSYRFISSISSFIQQQGRARASKIAHARTQRHTHTHKTHAHHGMRSSLNDDVGVLELQVRVLVSGLHDEPEGDLLRLRRPLPDEDPEGSIWDAPDVEDVVPCRWLLVGRAKTTQHALRRKTPRAPTRANPPTRTTHLHEPDDATCIIKISASYSSKVSIANSCFQFHSGFCR
jgi:hypothetical protein